MERGGGMRLGRDLMKRLLDGRHLGIMTILCVLVLYVLPPKASADQKFYVFLPYMDKPVGSIVSFDEGQKVIGSDVTPGTYRTRTTSSGCYWARLSGFGGTSSEIVANHYGNGPAIVRIAASDKGFESSRCGTWTNDLSAITSSPSGALSNDGTYIVGSDVEAGLWRAENTTGCYWARLSGFSGMSSDIIANHYASGSTLVQIASTDSGFKTSHCGTWTKQ